MICDVCDKNEAIGTGCVPLVPITVAYCRECLEANAHPWDVLVANTACLDGLELANEMWREMVTDTCKHLGKTLEQFNAEVAEEIKSMMAEENKNPPG